MERADLHPLDDTTTPVLVCGTLAGLAGAVAGMMPIAFISLVRGEGLTMPAKLVAAALMGRDALESDNAMAAVLIGLLITVVAASAAGALFTWLRRREPRFRLLIAEGVGFGLVLFGALWIALPYLNPTMHAHTPWYALALSYTVFGAALALQLPLRVGSTDMDVESVRKSLSEGV
jgi:hypothetical protein